MKGCRAVLIFLSLASFCLSAVFRVQQIMFLLYIFCVVGYEHICAKEAGWCIGGGGHQSGHRVSHKSNLKPSCVKYGLLPALLLR